MLESNITTVERIGHFPIELPFVSVSKRVLAQNLIDMKMSFTYTPAHFYTNVHMKGYNLIRQSIFMANRSKFNPERKRNKISS